MERMGTREISRLFSFEGYGSVTPRYVFVGLQEKAERSRLERNIRTRVTDPIFSRSRVDRKAALTALINTGGVSPSKAKTDAVSQWAIAARIVAGLEGTSVDDEYDRLGAQDGITWITEALPIPMHADTEEAWCAVPLPTNLKPSWCTYRTCGFALTCDRVRTIIESEFPPELLIAYGKPIAHALAHEFGIELLRGSHPSAKIYFSALIGQTVIVGTPLFLDSRGRPNCFGFADVGPLVRLLHEDFEIGVRNAARPRDSVPPRGESRPIPTTSRPRRRVVTAHRSSATASRSGGLSRTDFMRWAQMMLAKHLRVARVRREGDNNVQHVFASDVHIGIVTTSRATVGWPTPCIRVHIWTADLRRAARWHAGWRPRGEWPEGAQLKYRVGDRGTVGYLEFAWGNSDLGDFQRWQQRVEECVQFFVAARDNQPLG